MYAPATQPAFALATQPMAATAGWAASVAMAEECC